MPIYFNCTHRSPVVAAKAAEAVEAVDAVEALE